MKNFRLYTIISAILIATTLNGQSIYDALRFSNLNYEGTARSMALGNAFTALGGDLGAIEINPASSGVFRHSEFTFTPSLVNSLDRSTYMQSGPELTSNWTRVGISNIGWVNTYNTGRKSGLINLNFSIVANQTANYTSRTEVRGSQDKHSYLASLASGLTAAGIHSSQLEMQNDPFYNQNVYWEEVLAWNTALISNIYDPYTYIGATTNIFEDNTGTYTYLGGMLDQNYYQETTGYNQHITFNLGGNISHKLYFGLNFTFQSIWYSKYQRLMESAENPNDFDTYFERFSHDYRENISGLGFNMKAGIIYRPIAGLRLGATISTPTWNSFRSENTESMESEVFNERYYEESPINRYEYWLNSPLRWSLGVAYTFGSKALVSIDYESTNYGNMRFVTKPGMYSSDIEYYNQANYEMRTTFRRVNNLRAGLEIKPINQLSLRLGYSYYDFTEKGFDDSKHYASVGLGYAFENGFYLDMAYRLQCNFTRESFSLYNQYPTEIVSNNIASDVVSNYKNSNLLLTFGFKF